VEVMNANQGEFMNANALLYAGMYGLMQTAGSDCHHTHQQVFGGVETDEPCRTAAEVLAAIREGRAKVFRLVRD